MVYFSRSTCRVSRVDYFERIYPKKKKKASIFSYQHYLFIYVTRLGESENIGRKTEIKPKYLSWIAKLNFSSLLCRRPYPNSFFDIPSKSNEMLLDVRIIRVN